MPEKPLNFPDACRKCSRKMFERGDINLGELFALLLILAIMPRRVAQMREQAIESLRASGQLNAQQASDDQIDWSQFFEALMQFLMTILPLFLSR